MHDADGAASLGRRLRRLGGVLLLGAAAAFVWAIGFTQGVDGLLEGLVVAVAGLLVPAVALLWVGWVLGDATREPEFELPAPPSPEPPRRRALGRLMSYVVAIAAVAFATMIRTWLTPYMSDTMLSPTFLLAITVSAWVGGIGPALLATALSVPALWYLFLAPMNADAAAPRTGDLVGLGLFTTVALSIAGIASALRFAQGRSASLRADVRAREAALDESEARFREMADEAPAMIRVSDAQGNCRFFNRAWREFTGRAMEQDLGEGWLENVHAQDARRVSNALRDAIERREPFRLEYRLRRHDGAFRRVVDHGRPRIDRDGRLVGYIGACMEVGEARAERATA